MSQNIRTNLNGKISWIESIGKSLENKCFILNGNTKALLFSSECVHSYGTFGKSVTLEIRCFFLWSQRLSTADDDMVTETEDF